MAEKWKQHKILTLLVIIGAVYFFLKYLTPLTAPALIAMLFVTMFGPTLKKMQEKFHIHRQLGAVLLLLIACTIIVLLVWILFSWIVGSLPQWVDRLDSMEQQIGNLIHDMCALVGRTIGIDSSYLENIIQGQLMEGIDFFQLEALPDMLSQSLEYVKMLAAFGGFLVTFLIAAVLLAKDYDRIMNNLLDREECHMLLEVICGIIRYIATFVRAQLVIMSAIAVLAAFVLAIAGIEHGVLWGILAGLLDALPFVGTEIVLVPLAILQFVNGRIGQAAVCLILYGCCAFLREMLEPRLIGNRVGIPPIAVLVSVYAGIKLFGVWGIMKGPLGFMIIYQIWQSLQRRAGQNIPFQEIVDCPEENRL